MFVCLFNPLFGIKGHVALDRNPGLGYNTLNLLLIQGDFYDGLWYDPARGANPRPTA